MHKTIEDHTILQDNPCIKTCPDRNSECHAKCPRYAEFVKIRNAIYEKSKIESALFVRLKKN
jgi:hypothetical protein